MKQYRGSISKEKDINGQRHILAYITPDEAGLLQDMGGQETMTKEGILAYAPRDQSYSRDTGSDYGQFDRAVSRAANNPSDNNNNNNNNNDSGHSGNSGNIGNSGKAASAVGWITGSGPIKAIGAGLQFAGSKIFGPKVPPDQAGGASAKAIKMGGAKVSKKAISADRNRYTNLSHDQEDPGPERLMTTTLTTAPTADKSFGHQWDFKAYDNQQATTTPNVYDYSKAPYAKKGKMIYKYATGQEVKKRSLPPSKGLDSKGLPAILENSDYFKKLIG